jgi:uncharacterized protein YecT (DUF1311 family)
LKTIGLILTLLVVASPAIARGDVIGCIQSAESQEDINRCLSLEWQAVESQLQEVYRELAARYASADFAKRLEAVQKAHEVYVDALLSLKYPPGANEDSDTHAGCLASALVEYTRPHILNLETFLTESAGGICSHWN